MNFFAVYDPATGAIKRYGRCSIAADAALQARAEEAVALADFLPRGDRFAVDVAQKPPIIVAKP